MTSFTVPHTLCTRLPMLLVHEGVVLRQRTLAIILCYLSCFVRSCSIRPKLLMHLSRLRPATIIPTHRHSIGSLDLSSFSPTLYYLTSTLSYRSLSISLGPSFSSLIICFGLISAVHVVGQGHAEYDLRRKSATKPLAHCLSKLSFNGQSAIVCNKFCRKRYVLLGR